MPTIVLRLDPRMFNNPDLDIRYLLPDLLAARSGGVITDDGYDYLHPPDGPPFLILFLNASNICTLAHVFDVIEDVRLLDNDLRQGVVVAVERKAGPEIAYPPGFCPCHVKTSRYTHACTLTVVRVARR